MKIILNILCFLSISISLRAQVLPDSPLGKELQQYIATGLGNTTYARLQATADSLKGSQQYEESVGVLAQIVAHPHAPLSARAEAYLQLGIRYNELGKTPLAMQAFQEAVLQSEALVRADTGSVDKRYNLGRAYNEMGKMHRTLGETAQALQYLNRCNQIVHAINQSNPSLAYVKRTLAISCCELAVLEKGLGNLAVALEHSTLGAQLMLELQQSYPEDIDYQSGLANLTNEQGEIHRLMGHQEQALERFETSHQMALAVWATDTSNVENKNFLAYCCLKLGEVYDALDSLQTSLQYFEQYNRLEKALHESYPQNVNFKQSLAISYQYLGHLHSALEEDEKAKGYFEQFHRLAQELYVNYPQNAFYTQLLATSYVRLGDAFSALDQQEKALELQESGIKLLETLHHSYPDDIGYKHSLATSFANLAFFCQHRLEDKKKAKAYFQRAERLWAELVRDAPQFAQAAFFLNHVRADLASLDDHILEALQHDIQNEPDRTLQYQQYGMLCDSLRLRIKSGPKHNTALAQALNSKAWCGFFLQRFEAGEADIREGMSLQPDNPALIKNLAPALLLQGKDVEALDEYSRWKNKPFGDSKRVVYREWYWNDLGALEKAGAIPTERMASVAKARKLLKAK